MATLTRTLPAWFPWTQNKPAIQSGAGIHCTLQRKRHLKEALKNVLLIPVCPAIGYFCIDATGLTYLITAHHPALIRIVGEGFGHAGLCYSLHFVFKACRHLWQAIKPSAMQG